MRPLPTLSTAARQGQDVVASVYVVCLQFRDVEVALLLLRSPFALGIQTLRLGHLCLLIQSLQMLF